MAINKYRIFVDGQAYCGEVSVEFNVGRVNSPWSSNSFQTRRVERSTCRFETDTQNQRIVEGWTNLKSHLGRIIDCIQDGLMAGHKIVIESEPFTIPLEFNVNALFKELEKQDKELKAQDKRIADLETENARLKADIQKCQALIDPNDLCEL